MNMELSTRVRARLYAVTAVACVVWLVQSTMQSNADGSLWHWTTIVFSLSLLIVIGYTAYRAVSDWNHDDAADRPDRQVRQAPDQDGNDTAPAHQPGIRP